MDNKTTPSEGELALQRFNQKLRDQGIKLIKREVSDEEQPLVATFVSGKRLPIENKDTKQDK
jgi:hypothetical protein